MPTVQHGQQNAASLKYIFNLCHDLYLLELKIENDFGFASIHREEVTFTMSKSLVANGIGK